MKYKDDPFWRGFNERCAEYGVDPDMLYKTAGPLSDLMMRMWGPRPNLALEHATAELRRKRRAGQVTPGLVASLPAVTRFTQTPESAAARAYVKAIQQAQLRAKLRGGGTQVAKGPTYPRLSQFLTTPATKAKK